jgi:hypothetical protein
MSKRRGFACATAFEEHTMQTAEEVRPGDVVWFPPGEKHWHGATPTTAMTHIRSGIARRQEC